MACVLWLAFYKNWHHKDEPKQDRRNLRSLPGSRTFRLPTSLHHRKVGWWPIHRDRGKGWARVGPCVDPIWGLICTALPLAGARQVLEFVEVLVSDLFGSFIFEECDFAAFDRQIGCSVLAAKRPHQNRVTLQFVKCFI